MVVVQFITSSLRGQDLRIRKTRTTGNEFACLDLVLTWCSHAAVCIRAAACPPPMKCPQTARASPHATPLALVWSPIVSLSVELITR